MELSKNFIPGTAEEKWYQHWINKGYFSSQPDGREPYTIVIPPPNVTGVLHMGHCLNNTIQDILIRRARMQGKNACWVPGTDHASIATEAKVVAMLRERGITKSSLTRDEFLAYAWEWKEKYGGIILQQLRKLGCSLDWDRTSFTMDKDYYASVMGIFVKMYNEGLIYRGLRMVNWDPVGKTALSDEEVIFKEVNSTLYYVRYPFADGSGRYIMVATTRPETILGDVAIFVNPADERYQSFVGQEVIVPIINRRIPIMADEYVASDFGTGALKVTPAHDKNDNELGRKHQLKSINTLDAEGRFTSEELVGDNPSEQVLSYNGKDRFALRKLIAEDIQQLGQLEKTEDYKGQVGTSERTGAVIESRLSLQWFVNMKAFLAKHPQVLQAVVNNEISFHPAKTKNTYTYWIENIKDWCISRQLWWGQQIPAWYDEKGNCFVALTEEEAKRQAGNDAVLTRDEDVLDTWFSSWLWPMEVFKGLSKPGNKDVQYYYPTTTLVTGQDIIFFWVARMIMAGYEFAGQLPFRDVYFTGMVRDKQGRKMSKQLGNSPDLLKLIEDYGADAVRFGIMISSPAGNDLLFDESSLEQGKYFNNKLWNALKLVKGWETRTNDDTPGAAQLFAGEWFNSRLQQVKAELEQLMQQFRISEALKTVYSLIWDDFCSWYLEWVKPGFEQPLPRSVYEKSAAFFAELMQLLHPFMPFITEEIFHLLGEQSTDICVSQVSPAGKAAGSIIATGDLLKNAITSIRDARNKAQLKPKDEIELQIQTADQTPYHAVIDLLAKQVNAKSTSFTNDTPAQSITVVAGKEKYFVITGQTIETGQQKEDLLKEKEHLLGFLAAVEKKLSNERFVQNAKPDVVALEQKKKQDALTKLDIIEKALSQM